MFLYQGIKAPQLVQYERGKTIEIPLGIRYIHTFKKEPTQAPKINAMIAGKNSCCQFTFLVPLLVLFASLRSVLRVRTKTQKKEQPGEVTYSDH